MVFSASLTTGVVVGAGKTWSCQLTHCAAAALAEQPGTQLVEFPAAMQESPSNQSRSRRRRRRVIAEAN